MIEIRMEEAAGKVDRKDMERNVFSERYLIRRPVLDALTGKKGAAPVFLIDELDRTDEAFEAFLLEILSDFPGDGARARHDQGRRAADRHHHHQPHPRNPRRAEAALPVSLGRLSRTPSASWRSCAARCRRPTSGCRRRSWPSSRSCADRPVQGAGRGRNHRLGGALTELDKVALDPETVSDTIGVLLKYQDDIARIEQGEGRRILKEVKAELSTAAE
jgi:hypothetical protein